jgi:lycopene beta-cyclase
MSDWIIVGSGLAGKLSALYLTYLNPRLKIILIEQQSQLSESHTWSCFSSDIPEILKSFSNTLPWIVWDQHEVHFPHYHRTLSIGYQSLKEKQLNQMLLACSNIEIQFNGLAEKEQTYPSKLKELVVHFSKETKTFVASNILWCTGWNFSPHNRQGYQKFVGVEFVTSKPHGIKNPILMDANIEQKDGYRFFYVLPFSETELLIEDTYYSENSHLDIAQIKKEISEYLETKWNLFGHEAYQEVGVLPIPLSHQSPTQNHKALGVAGHQYHPVTGYSLPSIFKNLNNLQRLKAHPPTNQSLYLLLNRFLFLAAPPQARWRVFSFFYRHSDKLIQRFYSGQMTKSDWLKFFLKWPPPVKTLKALCIAWRFVKEMTFK